LRNLLEGIYYFVAIINKVGKNFSKKEQIKDLGIFADWKKNLKP
jgi:hypothetical protein